jgi:hypothetical protein
VTQLHDEEFKVRLTEADAAILRAFARKRRTKPAVVLREWAAAQIDRLAYSVPSSSENRRPA